MTFSSASLIFSKRSSSKASFVETAAPLPEILDVMVPRRVDILSLDSSAPESRSSRLLHSFFRTVIICNEHSEERRREPYSGDSRNSLYIVTWWGVGRQNRTDSVLGGRYCAITSDVRRRINWLVNTASSSLRASPFSLSLSEAPGWRLLTIGVSNSRLNVLYLLRMPGLTRSTIVWYSLR